MRHGLGKTLTSVAIHFLQVHGGRGEGIQAVGLTQVSQNIWGGDISMKLLRRDLKWIFNLDCITQRENKELKGKAMLIYFI